MNKTEVVYFSKSGHSRKIAQAIATALHTQAIDIRNAPVLNEVDLLIIVGGIYGGVSAPEMVTFAKGIDRSKVKKAALVTSCTSNITRQDQVRVALIQNKIDVIPDEYVCRGSILFFYMGHPSQEEIANAVSFAKKVAGE